MKVIFLVIVCFDPVHRAAYHFCWKVPKGFEIEKPLIILLII
jgi:hypothetical protein